MKKLWIKIKMLFGWKPKLVPIPINDFIEWNIFESEIAVLINLVRENRKPESVIRSITGMVVPTHKQIPELIPNKLCREEAIKRCQVQFDREVISHEGVGEAFIALKSKGYESPAEVLASGYTTPESVVEAWFKSGTHRRILLGTNYKYFGVSQLEHNKKKYYCILFCK